MSHYFKARYLFTYAQVTGPAVGQKAGFECHREVLTLKWVPRSDVWLKEQYVYLLTSRNAWLLKGDVTVLSRIIFKGSRSPRQLS